MKKHLFCSKSIVRKILYFFVGLTCVMGGCFVTADAAITDHQGENTYWSSGSLNVFHFPWSVSRPFTEVSLPANNSVGDSHYLRISDYGYAWATQDLTGVRNAKMGISKKNGKWYGNNYGYQSCTADNAWYDGNPFGKSSSIVGDYGSRYLMLAVLKLQPGSEYIFRPVLTQGEGEAVFSKLYIAVHGYAKSTTVSKGPSAGGMVSTAAVYPEVDWSTSWFNYNGTDSLGKDVYHDQNKSLSGTKWLGNESGYVTLILRSATGDTSLGAGLEVPVVNTFVDSNTTLNAAAVKQKGLDLGIYKYQFITYSPFVYTFVNNGTIQVVKRSGCESFSLPDMVVKENKTGYHVTGLKITSGGTALSDSSPVNKNTIYAISDTDPKSKLNQYCTNGRFYGVLFSDCTIETQYQANTYSIQYNLDGGTKGNNSPTAATFGNTFLVSAPKKLGYDFAGWVVSGDITTSTASYGETKNLGMKVLTGTICRTDSNGQIWFSSLTTKNKGSITLTAKWTEKKGEAPILRYKQSEIASGGGVYGWFNDQTVTEQANSDCFWAEDSDGDMVKLSLYAGDFTSLSLPVVSLCEGILWEKTVTQTSSTGILIDAGKPAYRYGKINYDFRNADSANTKEGTKIYTLVAWDSKGHVTKRKIIIQLDLTPPTLIGAPGTETPGGNGGKTPSSIWEIIKVSGNTMSQTASDALSGIAGMEIYAASDQGNPVERIHAGPWVYTKTRSDFAGELGIVVKTWDKAGNTCSKFLFLQNQLTWFMIPYLPSK